MLQGKPLFAGRDHVEQFCAITELLGTPNEDLLARITSPHVSSNAISLFTFTTAIDGHCLVDKWLTG